jgi:hypothetical protein
MLEQKESRSHGTCTGTVTGLRVVELLERALQWPDSRVHRTRVFGARPAQAERIDLAQQPVAHARHDLSSSIPFSKFDPLPG